MVKSDAMTGPGTALSAEALMPMIARPDAPLLIDTRRRPVFDASDTVVAGAVWRDHARAADWGAGVEPGTLVVTYCIHGHNVSQSACATLRARGIDARFLDGGLAAFEAAGGTTAGKSERLDLAVQQPSRWVTTEHPGLRQLACAWFIRRFLDRRALIHFTAPEWAAEVAEDLDATLFGRAGCLENLDDFLDQFGVAEAAARRVSGALEGLADLWRGVAALHVDDHRALAAGMALLDAQRACYRLAAS